MTAKHTPGPWVVEHDRRLKMVMVVAKGGGMTGILVNEMGRAATDADLANARLIAEAPELLDVLRELIAADGGGWATRHAAENLYCPDCATDVEAWTDQQVHHPGCAYVARIARANAALAKAEGR